MAYISRHAPRWGVSAAERGKSGFLALMEDGCGAGAPGCVRVGRWGRSPRAEAGGGRLGARMGLTPQASARRSEQGQGQSPEGPEAAGGGRPVPTAGRAAGQPRCVRGPREGREGAGAVEASLPLSTGLSEPPA